MARGNYPLVRRKRVGRLQNYIFEYKNRYYYMKNLFFGFFFVFSYFVCYQGQIVNESLNSVQLGYCILSWLNSSLWMLAHQLKFSLKKFVISKIRTRNLLIPDTNCALQFWFYPVIMFSLQLYFECGSIYFPILLHWTVPKNHKILSKICQKTRPTLPDPNVFVIVQAYYCSEVFGYFFLQ